MLIIGFGFGFHEEPTGEEMADFARMDMQKERRATAWALRYYAKDAPSDLAKRLNQAADLAEKEGLSKTFDRDKKVNPLRVSSGLAAIETLP